MGRWLSPDWNDVPDDIPYANLDDPQSLNLYSYVGNNPLGRIDSTGHDGDGVDCCTMEDIDSVVEPLVNSAEGALEETGSVAWGTASGVAGFFFLNPQQAGNDPAERRFVMNMMAQHGKQNISNEYSNYTDEELDEAYKNAKSTTEREKIKAEQKRRQLRRSRQSGGKKPKTPTVKNDPASVREREKTNPNPVPAPIPETTEDNSSVTTTQIDKLPKEPQDPQ